MEAAVAIQNLSMLSGNEAPIVQAGAIRALVPLLSSEDPAVQDAATGALANLSSFSDHDQRIVQAGALPALAKLVLSPHVVPSPPLSRLLSCSVTSPLSSPILSRHLSPLSLYLPCLFQGWSGCVLLSSCVLLLMCAPMFSCAPKLV